MTLSTFLFTLSLLFFFTSGSDLRSLLEFKKGIQSDPLHFISKWDPSALPDPNSCPHSWPGISCDSNSVISITLDHLGLAGDLKFSTLLSLNSLQNISLSGNQFTGRLVPALGSMSTLQYLDLSNNNFSGPIPGRIAELWNLKYLNLSTNGFEGGFPVGLPVGFRNLQQLRVLDLSSNRFWGDISAVLSELINLEIVDLSDNEFSGGFSDTSGENVSGLANTLHLLNLRKNKLNGGFLKADVIGLFRNLEVLDLGNNEVNGELPSFGSLTNLKVLRLGNNQLFGGIPEELLNGSIPIEELDLSGNGFTGYINGIHSTTLNVLNVSSNGLKGHLPTYLQRCSVLDLSGNMITGDMSVMQNWGATLEVLDLSSNQLSRSLPNLTPQFVRLRKLNLRNNSLKGNLPQLWDISTLSSVDLSLNQLNGPIPGSFFTSLTLTNLNLSGNQFSGPIPVQGSGAGELLVLPSYPLMESLDVSQNSLSGPLPSGIGNFANLKSLNLSGNNLTGQLPVELSKLTYLQYLDLSANNFQGKIPDKLPSSLIGLNMSDNDLSGNIPQNLRNKFDITSFLPGNPSLIIPKAGGQSPNSVQNHIAGGGKHGSKRNITIAIIVATVGAAAMVAFVLLAYQRAQRKEFHGRSDFSGQTAMEDAKLGKSSRTSLFKFQLNAHHPPTSLSFSNNHLLTANSRSLSGQTESATEIVEHSLYEGMMASSSIPNLLDDHPTTSGRKSSPETTPRRYSLLSFSQRLKVAVDVARCLLYLHDRGMLHGNLKPANILLEGPDYNTRLTDYGLHRLMTPAGIAEQILNLGALGYRAHELDNASKPAPSFKADVYAFGVILMELLTRRSAGDIISGQSGAVDLTDWVQLCDQEGRRMDCIDRDIAGGEEPTKAMDDLLAISLKCILPVNERPNIRQVFDELCSISV
ncbi:inactive receptor kinase [Populus alba x Populus x berolinensis]|uniref:Inactive receptor kinase n=1 Tax=Populus alba x Populus x berolinensis TaxID=444605 RepID=A0AAD6QUF1_9ROSI|nr:inactive receptor kinase [Populus alba x Populus x berolinensis]